jgi:hypothetical protein
LDPRDQARRLSHYGAARRRRRAAVLAQRYDFADRFPRIVEAVASLPVQSCFVDGEAIIVDANGLSVFDLLRCRRHDGAAALCAFDLIELDGKDLRKQPIEERKHALANVLYRERDGIIFNQHYDGDGAIIDKQACKLGCEGIVSKRLGYPYGSGRVDHWLKIKNPAAPAVKREAEEDWGGKRKGRGVAFGKEATMARPPKPKPPPPRPPRPPAPPPGPPPAAKRGLAP